MVRQVAGGRRTDGEEPSVPSRTRSRPASGALGVRKTIFAIGGMSSLVRRRLAKRLRAELADVRVLLEKAEQELILAAVAGKSGLATSSSSPAPPPCGGKGGRFLAAGLRSCGAPLEAASDKSARKTKASPFLLKGAEAPKMTPDERERLVARLASPELPAQIVELLRRHRRGSSGKNETIVRSIDDAALFELKQQLDKCTKEIRNGGHERTDASAVIHPSPSPQQRQADDGKVVEKDEDAGICGRASPVAAALSFSSLFPDHGELVGATGANLLSPLPRKHIALAERTDVSPTTPGATTLRSLLPEYSELVGVTGVSLLSPLPRKYVAFAERAVHVCGGVSPISTTLSSLLPAYGQLVDASGDSKMLSPLPRKYAALAEEDEYVDICGDASPVVIVRNHGEIVSDSSSSSSDSDSVSTSGSESDSSDSDSDSDSNTDEIVGNPSPAPAPATPPDAGVSSAQPSEAAQTAKQEKLTDQLAGAAAPPKPLTDLIARAQGALARRRQDEKAQAREKARQELLEMERTALASDAIHPLDMELLGIAAVEYMVSSDEEVCRALSPLDCALRSAPSCCLSLLQRLGLFLKADGGGDKEQQQPGFVVGDDDDDVEEGEIR